MTTRERNQHPHLKNREGRTSEDGMYRKDTMMDSGSTHPAKLVLLSDQQELPTGSKKVNISTSIFHIPSIAAHTLYSSSTLLNRDQIPYLGSQGPGSMWFPAVAPGSLSRRGPVRAACSPWSESSVPDPRRTENSCSRSSRLTDPRRPGSAARNSSTCRVCSRYRERKET